MLHDLTHIENIIQSISNLREIESRVVLTRGWDEEGMDGSGWLIGTKLGERHSGVSVCPLLVCLLC